MGNPTRCPQCNKFGDPNLGNYCKRCDIERYRAELNHVCNGSSKVLMGALLEVGAKSILQIRREDRSRVLNIIKRRQQKTRRKALVQGASPLESTGMFFATEPVAYKAEKEVADIESLE